MREQFLTNLDPKQSLSLEAIKRPLRDLDRKRLSPLRAQRVGFHSAACAGSAISSTSANSPATDLRRLFFYRLDRVVRRDCTFLLHSRFYEAPPHLCGETIEVRFDPLDAAEVEIYFQGKLPWNRCPG